MEKVGLLKDKGGNLCLEAEDVGEILNKYFASVFTQEKDMEDREIRVEQANMLGRFEINKEVVLGLLKSIKVDKSPKPDGIHRSHGQVLEDWRVANMVSLFKKGN
eukprot:g40782.t1